MHTKERQLATAKRCCDSYGDAWIWVAFAPVWRLVVAFVVGKRTRESANQLLERVGHVTDAHIPSSGVTPCEFGHAAPVLAPTRGSGSPRRWLPVTPAMAAGITDHVWTTSELLSYRVPADLLDQLPKLESLFPPITVSHHGN